MSLLFHFSDPHFGVELAPVMAALKALAHSRRPDLLVLSGDITQRAQTAEFAAARRFCDELPRVPMLTLPGNHDIPLMNLAARLLRPYGRYMAAFGKNLEPTLETDDMLLVGVNTTRATRHKDGEVSAAQISEVCRRLEAARPAQLRVVVTHQPSAVIRADDEPDRLHGAEAALQAWSAAGADLVLGGHIHLPYVVDLKARPRSPTPRRMWCVQAGTAVSSRIRHNTRNSVNLIHWNAAALGSERHCMVERCDYDPQTRVFITASEQTLLLD
ncbi:MAG TPA: metallophosphoesterase [Ramlibacter sp.]|nr:metallophosphoesterase [Ramlibacter sp.]